MRVLQIGLEVLAQSLKVPFEYKDWGNVINDIEGAIKKIEKGSNKTENWRENQTFYSECATQFQHFKDAWRNHAMHGRGFYDEAKARMIYISVREFMRMMALRFPILATTQ